MNNTREGTELERESSRRVQLPPCCGELRRRAEASNTLIVFWTCDMNRIVLDSVSIRGSTGCYAD